MKGCIFAEILTGAPLFSGDTDLDQLFRIMRHLGPLPLRWVEIFSSNTVYLGVRIPQVSVVYPLSAKLPRLGYMALNWLEVC